MRKKFFAILLVIAMIVPAFSAGWYNPKDELATPMSNQTWECVEVWNGGSVMARFTNARIKVISMFSSAGMFASKENSTSWLVYQVTGTLDGKTVTRNFIDSDATSIQFW